MGVQYSKKYAHVVIFTSDSAMSSPQMHAKKCEKGALADLAKALQDSFHGGLSSSAATRPRNIRRL